MSTYDNNIYGNGGYQNQNMIDYTETPETLGKSYFNKNKKEHNQENSK
jgi:hypothetical protein